MSEGLSYEVEGSRCIRCAACASVAPGLFTVAAGPARVLRDAQTAHERVRATAAFRLCPTSAIVPRVALARTEAVHAPVPPQNPDDFFASLSYLPLIEQAEAVRWKLPDLPWSTFDRERATPGLRAVVREMAFYEQATFSATQRFMHSFGDDLDFSQWISIWFYEETRHPLALLRWLHLGGETIEPAFVARGRVSAPFMRSKIGTLVTNIISEITAAQAYLALADAAPEPLLGKISQKIAADEGRHAASFFSYARSRFEQSKEPARDRLDTLKVLHFWLNEVDNVTHPVNQTMRKLEELKLQSGVRMDWPALRSRMCHLIGGLVDVPLSSAEEVAPVLSKFTSELHRAG